RGRPRRLVAEEGVEGARGVGVAEDRRLRDDGHVVLERHRGGHGIVDEHLGADEDPPADADTAPPVEGRTGGGGKRRVARDDVQPALADGPDDAHSLRLRSDGDVPPQLLEHSARLCPAARGLYWMRRKGRYSVRSIAAGCGSWSRRQIVWLRAWFCCAIVQRSNDCARSKPRRAATIAGRTVESGSAPRGCAGPRRRTVDVARSVDTRGP